MANARHSAARFTPVPPTPLLLDLGMSTVTPLSQMGPAVRPRLHAVGRGPSVCDTLVQSPKRGCKLPGSWRKWLAFTSS